MKVRLPLNHKYKAKPREVDGIRFASQKEAKKYQELKALRDKGDILFFLRQCPFDLPGKVRYFLDFIVFWKDGNLSFIEVKSKGTRTPVYIMKKKQVESLYNIEIEEV